MPPNPRLTIRSPRFVATADSGERLAENIDRPQSRAERGQADGSDRRFRQRFGTLFAAANAAATRHDAIWQKRRRVFVSLPDILFVFRLILAPRDQGYRTTLCELREQCEAAFKEPYREILKGGPNTAPWMGHRIHRGSHHPMGMTGAIHRVHDRAPVGCDLVSHENERKAALGHLQCAHQFALILPRAIRRGFALR